MSELPWTSTLQVNRLYDLLDEGLVVLDNSGVIVYSNQAFADSLQYSAGDLLESRFDDLIAEEQKGTLHLHLTVDGSRPLDLTLMSRDGKPRVTSVRSLNLIDEELPKGFCLLITDKKEQHPDFERIVASAYLKMVIVDTDLNITFVNPAFGVAASEIIGTPVVNGVDPEYREMFRQKLETAMKAGINQEFEFSETLGGNPTTWHELRIGPIREGTEIIGAVIAGFEITDRLEAMRALEESEEKFRGVFEHANDAITLVDAKGMIVAINSAQEKIFGIKRADVIGMPLWELQASMLSEGEKTPEYRKYLQQSLETFFESGTAPWLEKTTEGEFIHPLDGSHKTFEQTSFRIPTSKGFMLCSFVWDTTEQTQIEEARKTSENRYRALFEENNDGVAIIDLAGKIVDANAKAAEILGFTNPDETIGLPFTETAPEDGKSESISRFEDLMDGKVIPTFERSAVKRDGTEIIAEMNVSLVNDQDGNPLHVQIIMRDITDNKEAQAALDEVRERYELALKGADLGVWDWNPEADEMVFSERWADILGYSVDEIEPNYSGWEKLIHPDDLSLMESRWDAHVDGITPFYSSEHRMRTKAGGWKWVLERGRVVEWKEDGGTKRATGTLLDITERKVFEKALEQSEQKYRNLLENIPQKVFYKNRDSAYIAVNPAYADDLGISPDEVAGKTDYDFFPKELADYFVSSDREVLESLKPVVLNESHILDEETRFSQIVKAPVRDDEGTVVGILGIFWDTTDATRAAEALGESETKYRSLIEQSVMGLAILPQGIDNIVFANPKIGEILGYSPDELIELNNEQINSLIHPEDVETLIQYLNSLLRTTESGESIHVRMNHKNGSQIWTEVSAGGIEYEDTPAVQVSVVDITKRVKAEEALKESEQKFRRIFEFMPVSMYLLRYDEDEGFTLADANPASDRLFKIEHSKYLGKKISEIRMPHRSTEIPVRLKEVVTTGEPWNFDEVIYDGDEIRMAVQIQAFRTTADTVVHSFLDITERMIQDLEIKRLNESLTRRVDERTAELAAANKELEAFAYSVSHDLRAPLRTIDGFSQALMEDYSDSIDDTGKDFLHRVRTAATHMGSLIEDLLVLSRVTRAEMDRTDVDLSEIARTVYDEIHDADPERQVDFKITENILARCDRRLIKLVLQNLLDNAWKFTGKATEARIEFGTTEKDGETLFYVKDNGAGFNMDYSDKLFVPFQRLHQIEDFEGSGIGLATVQRIINRHGGRVWAKGVVDEGSTFFFTIPESRS